MIKDFASVTEALSAEAGVERGRMFGTEGLKIVRKFFAMEVKGELVVKVSLARATEIIEAGEARRFDPGHGRPMKQWVSVPPGASIDWLALAREAKSFVAGA